jgi:hypothetical protein
MTRASEPAYQARIDTFIGEPAHLHAFLAVDQFFVGQVIRSKCLGRANIITGQPRVVGENGLGAHPSSQLSKDKLDRNASAADHRLPAHNLGVHLDAFVGHLADPNGARE